MKFEFLITLSLSLFLSCQKSENKNSTSSPRMSKIDTSKIAIFKYDNKNRECNRIFSSGENSNLENTDLIKIETSLKQIINKQNKIQEDLFNEYSKSYPSENYKLQDFIIKEKNYIRRYLVIKNLQGEKEVFVSLICQDIAKHLNWKKNLNEGYGGGSCLFSFKLNLSTNKYYSVYFHAEA